MKKLLSLLLVLCFTFNLGSFAFAESDTTFTDINNHWAKADIMELASRGIVKGVGNNKFNPEGPVKVDEFIKICLSAIGTQFDTSKYPYWATPYINEALKMGIIDVKQFPNTQRAITREEMASVLIRTYGKVESIYSSNLNQEIIKTIGDYSLINDYYKDSVLKAYNVGLLRGNKGLFRPTATTTRAEAVSVIMLLLKPEKLKPFTFDAPYTMATYVDWTEDMGWEDFQVKVYAPKNAIGGYETAVLNLYDVLVKNAKVDKGYYDVLYNPYKNLVGVSFVPITFDTYDALGENGKLKYTQLGYGVQFMDFGVKGTFPYQLISYYDGTDKVEVFEKYYGIFLKSFFEELFGAEASYAKNLFYKAILDTNSYDFKTYVINDRNVRINHGQIHVSEKIK